MSRELARVAVATRIEELKATWTAYALLVEQENLQAVNLATQVLPYLKVELVYISAEQAEISRNPRHRAYGHVLLTACVREGQGTKRANELLEHFYVPLQMQDGLPPLRTFAADFVRSKLKEGWVHTPVLIPFYYDTVY